MNDPMQWLEQGWAPIPLVRGTKRPIVKWRHWQNNLPPRFMVEQWFGNYEYNLGLIIPQDAVVLDFDNQADFSAWYAEHDIDTFMAQTGRGVHVYLKCEDRPLTTCKMAGGDIKASGYVVAPPSLHPSGALYQVLNDRKIAWVENLDSLGIYPIWNKTSVDGEGMNKVAVPGVTIVEKLNAYLNVVHLLLERNIEIHKMGAKMMACCPFHDDKNPSMAVYPEENSVYCFSTHCVNGRRRIDALGLFSLLNRMDNIDSIQLLARFVE